MKSYDVMNLNTGKCQQVEAWTAYEALARVFCGVLGIGYSVEIGRRLLAGIVEEGKLGGLYIDLGEAGTFGVIKDAVDEEAV